jgi:O-antigen ligase
MNDHPTGRARAAPQLEPIAWPVERGRLSLRIGRMWLDLLCAGLLGYALLGRGWAYMGVSPVYVGEVVLLAGLLVLLVSPGWRGLLNIGSTWALVVLAIWGTVRTAPYLPVYGVDALRDAVIWGYSGIAIAVAGVLIADPPRVRMLIERYRWFLRVFLCAIPVLWLVFQFFGEQLPRWPNSGVPLLYLKAGDVLVHLGGVLAFLVLLGTDRGRIWVPLLILNVVLVGVANRGGLAAFLLAACLCTLLRPRSRWLWGGLATFLLGLVLLGLTGARFSVPGSTREVSFDQLVTGVTSIFTDRGGEELQGTKEWRMEFWRTIIGYTIHGEYFWTGKGFGINLADDDGFQIAEDHSVRAPHNGHMTMLARGGVPGLVLWAVVQLGWAFAMLDGYVRSRRAQQQQWAALFMFLLIYWLMFMSNTSFDVFIEGPMGGIWFWTLYGVGMAAVWLHRHEPQVLGSDEDSEESAATR